MYIIVFIYHYVLYRILSLYFISMTNDNWFWPLIYSLNVFVLTCIFLSYISRYLISLVILYLSLTLLYVSFLFNWFMFNDLFDFIKLQIIWNVRFEYFVRYDRQHYYLARNARDPGSTPGQYFSQLIYYSFLRLIWEIWGIINISNWLRWKSDNHIVMQLSFLKFIYSKT